MSQYKPGMSQKIKIVPLVKKQSDITVNDNRLFLLNFYYRRSYSITYIS